MSPEDWLRAEMQGEIVALVHSHPGGLPWLSEADRRLQVQSDLPWWLVCRGEIHKFRCVPHLTGRRFEHGATDCYTLFRDAYHLAGIEMPDFHREDDWWCNGQNLYLDNLEATGLYQVPLSSAQPGDVLLCCFGSSVPNHAAIYCGDGELLHHIPEQLSKRERYTDKWQRRTHSLWRHRAWHASTAFNQHSDRDLKDNIQVIDNATDRIRKMNGYTYTLKENGMPYAGVIAQEALEAIPEVVGSAMKYQDGASGSEGEEGERYYTVDYSGVTGLLVQVARESDDRITALEEENAELRQRLSAIEAALVSK